MWWAEWGLCVFGSGQKGSESEHGPTDLQVAPMVTVPVPLSTSETWGVLYVCMCTSVRVPRGH